MTVGYFDASALVKMVLDEEDSALAVDFWNDVSVAALAEGLAVAPAAA